MIQVDLRGPDITMMKTCHVQERKTPLLLFDMLEIRFLQHIIPLI